MVDFSKIKFSDATISDIRIFPSSIEVVYTDWQENLHTLLFSNTISCFMLSAHGKALSHGEIENNSEYLRECCQIAEEDSWEEFRIFNFVESWNDRIILRIISKNVCEKF